MKKHYRIQISFAVEAPGLREADIKAMAIKGAIVRTVVKKGAQNITLKRVEDDFKGPKQERK